MQVMLTEQEASDIGIDAYIYLYPLVMMDITRKQLTNGELMVESGRGPMNLFVNVPGYPPAEFKGVVRSNFDTLYSIAWLDLTKEPLVVSTPDTDGRYYLLPMLDMWTDVFASPGWRTTGTRAAHYCLEPRAALVRGLRLFIAASAIARIARALQRLSRGSAQLQIALSARQAGRLSRSTRAFNAVDGRVARVEQ
jgi:Protein of unknown function (DUF1254)